jgi:ribosomal protein S18 acetylase RimI-like enzyme
MMNEGNLTIRSATIGDLDAIVEMWWESSRYHEELEPRFQYAPDAIDATRQFISKQIESEDSHHWVAQKDDDLVGYVEAMVVERAPIHLHRRIGYLGSIYVKSEARQKGIGTKLWKTAYDWLMTKEVAVINLMVASKNPRALDFWKKLNFREIMVRMELESS